MPYAFGEASGIGLQKEKYDNEHNYQQIFTFSLGLFQPTSILVTKGLYAFSYDNQATNTALIEAGWATRLFWLGGTFYFSESLAYSRFSGTYPIDKVVSLPAGALSKSINLNMHILGLDSRLVHAWEWFPIAWVIPFFEMGYLYTFYSQFGSSDFDSAQGGIGNLVGAAGIRFWLNPSASVRSENTESSFSLPIFLSLKWNRIFSNSQNFDMADNNLFLSAGFGL